LSSPEFAESARLSPGDFTRQRALPLPQLVGLLLNLRKGTLRDELDGFWEVLTGEPLAQGVSASAFCQARQKLNPSALLILGERLVRTFAEQFCLRRWHGWRLLATDGSTVRLPNTADVAAVFGPPPNGSAAPLGRFSQLYDVLNDVVVDADVLPHDVGERVLAAEHLAATGPTDLMLYDRGYPAFWLFVLHQIEQRHFCARVPATFSNEVKAFLASGARSALVTFTPGSEARKQCQAFDLPCDPINVRLVRVTLDNGQTEVLATSLHDEGEWPTAWFKGLYHLRWGVEEAYKREKCRIEIENFSGLSAQVVRQDIYAKLFTLNLTAICAWVAQAIADRLYQHRRHAYRINFAHALSKMKASVVRLLLGAEAAGLLCPLVLAMVANVEAVRPDRAAPRKMKPAKLQGFFPNNKRCR
jgi:hypothetical protein